MYTLYQPNFWHNLRHHGVWLIIFNLVAKGSLQLLNVALYDASFPCVFPSLTVLSILMYCQYVSLFPHTHITMSLLISLDIIGR